MVEELVKRGHEVTLFATGDSKTKAKLVSVKDRQWNNDYSEPIEYLNIANAFSEWKNFDIIDCHVEQKACFFADLVKTPTIVNISYGEFSPDDLLVLKRYKHLNYLSISNGLQNFLQFLNWVGNIYHGIDTTLFPFQEEKGDYLLFLGRMSPQKGPHIAIEIAKHLGKKLILAGKTVPEDKEYLDRFVFPFIDNKQIIYKGVANFEEKISLYKNALAFIHPIQYFEAFGLTIIESLACGTPVISFDNGAPREIIEDGKTGFLVKNKEEMISAIQKIDQIKRFDCRQSVENKFSSKLMVDEYEKLYKSLIDK